MATVVILAEVEYRPARPKRLFGRVWFVRTKWPEGEANRPVVTYRKLLKLLLFGEAPPMFATTHELRCNLIRGAK